MEKTRWNKYINIHLSRRDYCSRSKRKKEKKIRKEAGRLRVGRHNSGLRTLGTQDVRRVSDEAFPNQGSGALGADKAVIVPMSVLEGDELRATNAGNGLGAGIAALREELPVTVGAVRFIILRSESLAGERSVTVAAAEALAMPGLVLVGDTACADHLLALGASRRELLLVAGGAEDFLVLGDEGAGADGLLAEGAAEALVVPLLPFVFHLLHAGTEDLVAAITSRRECLVVAIGTEYPVVLRSEGHIHQGDLAHIAEEAMLVPVLLLVGQVLGVDAYGLGTLVTLVREDIFIAFDTVGLLFSHDVPLSSESLVALPAAEVVRVPVSVHRLRVLAGEDQLVAGGASRFVQLGVVSLAVDDPVSNTVSEIHEQLITSGTSEAGWMPARRLAHLRRHDGHVILLHDPRTLSTFHALGDGSIHIADVEGDLVAGVDELLVDLPLHIRAEMSTIGDGEVLTRQLQHELLLAELLSLRVGPRHDVVGQGGHVLLHLLPRQTGRHPGVAVAHRAGNITACSARIRHVRRRLEAESLVDVEGLVRGELVIGLLALAVDTHLPRGGDKMWNRCEEERTN